MSIIRAGTTTTTALTSIGNTDGTLQFQINGTTTSLTLNTLGAVGVGSTPNFGTSGQVLTSAGPTAAPTWTTVSGSSQWVTSGSDIYYNTGNVGIGTSSPTARLQVRNNLCNISLNPVSNAEARIQAEGETAGTGTAITLYTYNGSANGERVRVTAAGGLLAGTTSTTGWPSGTAHVFRPGSATFTGVSIGDPSFAGAQNQISLGLTAWTGGGANYFTSRITTISDGALTFGTQATASSDGTGTVSERARITSGGNLLVGDTSAPGVAGARLYSAARQASVNSDTLSDQAASNMAFNTASGSNDSGATTCYLARYATASAINPGALFKGYQDSTIVIKINNNGNVTNSNNSYGSLSDARLKENVTDATPKLENLNKLRVVNFSLKNDPKQLKQIGLIAQEVEQVFPGLVETAADEEGTKAVKYSVLVPMLLKAMQEQQAMIEQLKADVAALKGQP